MKRTKCTQGIFWKSICLVIALGLFKFDHAHGQWWSLSGNVLTGNEVLGTLSSHDLRVFTGGSEKVRVTTAGSVGIGTMNPHGASKLHIQNGIAFLSGGTAFGGPMIVFDDDLNASSPNGEWGIEYVPAAQGLNFWRPFPNTNFGNYFLFLADNGDVGVGTSVLNAKFQVENTNRNLGGWFRTNVVGSASNTGLRSSCSGSTSINVGILSSSTSASGGTAFGYRGMVNGTGVNYGARFDASVGSSNTGVYALGVGGSTTNIGVRGQASGGSGSHYGIYGVAPGSSIFDNNWAGYFSGDIYAPAAYFSSDSKLKQDLKPISDANAILAQLNPQSYYFKTNDYPHLSLPSQLQYGLVAQDVESILPEVVKNVHHLEEYDSTGKLVSPAEDFKAINYTAFIPILIQGVKDQQAKIQELEARLAAVEGPQKQSGENLLKGENWLGQNSPNPFHTQTRIRYAVVRLAPETYIRVVSVDGLEQARFPISQVGEGEILVPANALSDGTYFYQLVVGGEQIASKTMVLTK